MQGASERTACAPPCSTVIAMSRDSIAPGIGLWQYGRVGLDKRLCGQGQTDSGRLEIAIVRTEMLLRHESRIQASMPRIAASIAIHEANAPTGHELINAFARRSHV